MILIDMNMPRSCAACDFLKVPDTTDYFQCIPDGRYMYDEDKIWMTEKRPNWCPLKAIPGQKTAGDNHIPLKWQFAKGAYCEDGTNN